MRQYGPQAKARALSDLAEQAECGSAPARRFLMQIEHNPEVEGPSVRCLMQMLRSDDAQQAVFGLQSLRARMPDAEQELNDFRSQAIMRSVLANDKPTVAQLDRARVTLQEEVNHGNAGAGEWLAWAHAAREVQRLSIHGGTAPTAQDRDQAVSTLSTLAAQGNVYARQELFAILVSGSAYKEQLQVAGRPVLTPELDLGREERSRLNIQALEAISHLSGSGRQLTSNEARLLATVLGQATSDRNTALFDQATLALQEGWARSSTHGPFMQGLFEAIGQRPPVPGRMAIADLYLQHVDQPQFARHLQQIVNMACTGDDIAMYMLAGAIGRRERSPEVFSFAQRALTALGQSNEHRNQVVQALILRIQRAGDQNNLLSTLGSIVGNWQADVPPQLLEETRRQFRKSFDQSLRGDSTVDPFLQCQYESAVKGYMCLARHWQAEDLGKLTKRMTPEIARGFKVACEHIPSGLQDAALKRVLDRLRQTRQKDGEWIPCLAAIGNLATYLQKSHVQELSAFLNVAPRQNIQLQMALGRCLLKAIADGSEEVRGASTDHFLKSGFSQRLGREASDQLIAYARGDSVDPNRLARITELAYVIGVKPPVNHLARALSTSDIGNRQLERAIEAAGGEDKFRILLERITLYNALPRALQETLRNGATDIASLSADSFVPGPDNMPAIITANQLVDRLSGDQGRLTGDLAVLDQDLVSRLANLRAHVLARMAERVNEHPEHAHHRLVATRLQTLAGNLIELGDQAVDRAVSRRKATLLELAQVTKDGHGTSGWWLLQPSCYIDRRWGSGGNQGRFENRQNSLVDSVQSDQREIREKQGEMRRFQAVIQSLDLADQARQQFALAASGERAKADELLLNMANEHGTACLSVFAPHSYKALTGTGTAAWEQGAWGRLYQNSFCHMPVLPRYSIGHTEVVAQALETLGRPNLFAGPDNADANRYDQQHMFLRLAGRDLVVHEALRAIDSHPAIMQTTQASAEIAMILPVMNKLFKDGMEGERGPQLVNYVRELEHKVLPDGRKTGLSAALDKLEANMPAICQLREQLRQQRSHCRDGVACRGLDQRINALDQVVTAFGPSGTQIVQLREMCRLIRSGSFEESSAWRQLRDTGVVVAGTVAIVALVVATCGTATPLAVIGGAVLIASAGLAFREGYAELSYQLDWTGNGGCQLGNSIRRRQGEMGLSREGFLIYDPARGQFTLPPTTIETLISYGYNIGADALTNIALMGFGHLVGKGLNWVTGISDQAERAAAVRLLNSLSNQAGQRTAVLEEALGALPQAAQTYWRRVAYELGNQAGFTIATDATAEAIQHGFHTQNFLTGMAAALVVVAGHRTAVHGIHYGLTPRWLRPGAIELPVDREGFVLELKKQLNRVRNPPPVAFEDLADGNLRVTVDGKRVVFTFISPEAALARVRAEQSRRAETAVAYEGDEGSTQARPTINLTGAPHGWESRRIATPGAEVESATSARRKDACQQMDRWIDLMTAGDSVGATEHALKCGETMIEDGWGKFNFRVVDIPIDAIKDANTETHLNRLAGRDDPGLKPQTAQVGRLVEVRLPKPIFVLKDGTRVDVIQRAQLTPEQKAELDTALATACGQAILRKVSLQAMEEMIVHANEIYGGGRMLSATQAEFSLAVTGKGVQDGPARAEISRVKDHERALDGRVALGSAVSEQGVLALMFERGAPWELIHQVGQNSRHAQARENILEYLRRQHLGAESGSDAANQLPQPVRLPGAPAPNESNIPEILLKSETVDADVRTQLRQMQAAAEQEWHALKERASRLPNELAEMLELALAESLGALPDNMTIERARELARDLTTAGETFKMDFDFRRHFVDPLLPELNAGFPDVRNRVCTARLFEQMVKDGIADRRHILALEPQLADELRPLVEQLPPYIRRHYIDPVFARPFDRAVFNDRHAQALHLARQSQPARVVRLGRDLTAAGNERARLEDLLFESIRDINEAYQSARQTEASQRTPQQNELIEAMNRAGEHLGIRTACWHAIVNEPLLAEKLSDARLQRQIIELGRMLSQRMADSGLTEADVKEIWRLPELIRRTLAEPMIRAGRFQNGHFTNQMEVARAYRDRGLSSEQIEAALNLDPHLRAVAVDPYVRTQGQFDSTAFDTAIQAARGFANASLSDRLTALQGGVDRLEVKMRQDPANSNSLTQVEKQQLESGRVLLARALKDGEKTACQLHGRIYQGEDLSRGELAELAKLLKLSQIRTAVKAKVAEKLANEGTNDLISAMDAGRESVHDGHLAQQAVFAAIGGTGDGRNGILHDRRPNGSLYENGYRIYQSHPDSALDHAKGDMLLVNINTGEYYILDVTLNPNKETSRLQEQGLIQLNNGHVRNGSLNDAGKEQVCERIGQIIATRSPLNVVDYPPPSLTKTPLTDPGTDISKAIAEVKQAIVELERYRLALKRSENEALQEHADHIKGFAALREKLETLEVKAHFDRLAKEAFKEAVEEVLKTGEIPFAPGAQIKVGRRGEITWTVPNDRQTQLTYIPTYAELKAITEDYGARVLRTTTTAKEVRDLFFSGKGALEPLNDSHNVPHELLELFAGKLQAKIDRERPVQPLETPAAPLRTQPAGARPRR